MENPNPFDALNPADGLNITMSARLLYISPAGTVKITCVHCRREETVNYPPEVLLALLEKTCSEIRERLSLGKKN